MERKSINETTADLALAVGPANMYALGCYARLLQRCGVKKLTIQRIIIKM